MVFITIFIGIAFAYYFIQKDRIRREERHEKMQEKQQELIDMLRARNEKDQSRET